MGKDEGLFWPPRISTKKFSAFGLADSSLQ